MSPLSTGGGSSGLPTSQYFTSLAKLPVLDAHWAPHGGAPLQSRGVRLMGTLCHRSRDTLPRQVTGVHGRQYSVTPAVLSNPKRASHVTIRHGTRTNHTARHVCSVCHPPGSGFGSPRAARQLRVPQRCGSRCTAWTFGARRSRAHSPRELSILGDPTLENRMAWTGWAEWRGRPGRSARDSHSV